MKASCFLCLSSSFRLQSSTDSRTLIYLPIVPTHSNIRNLKCFRAQQPLKLLAVPARGYERVGIASEKCRVFDSICRIDVGKVRPTRQGVRLCSQVPRCRLSEMSGCL